MPRPLWSGTIQISLVSFAVEVYPATNSARPITFHEVDRRTMGRVHRQNISTGWAEPHAPAAKSSPEPDEKHHPSADPKTSLHLTSKELEDSPAEPEADENDTRVVDKPDIVKSFEYERGKYAIVEPQELKNLRLAGKRTVELAQFAKLSEIDPVLYEKPYFVFPKKGPQANAFAVVRQAMIESGMVGIGEIVFSGRQHLLSLAAPHDPAQPGMMLYTLRFGTELRDAGDYANNAELVEPDASQLGLAKQLIDAYTRPFELAEYHDHYEQALRELVESKIHHRAAPEDEPSKKPAKVIDLMEALQKSLASKKHPANEDGAPSEQEPKKKPVRSARKSTAGKNRSA